MVTSYMPRQKIDTVTKTARLINEINEALQKYSVDQLISENAAINQLLREILKQKGYMND